ncbi:MAG TPA: OB-fold domain-containing protein [Solirubrobacterales bacterium]|jgi:hypothetical protein
MGEIAQPQRGIVPPPIDADSADFWAGLAEREIRLPKCGSCGTIWFPPTPGCAECGSTARTTVTVRPHGEVYSWVVVYRSLQPEFAEELPYVVATVALDEGPRLFARLFEVEVDRIEPGMGVSAVFYTVGDQWLLGFAPDAAANDEGTEATDG